jgi:uncharacterized protein YcbK (DUF882 family)
MHRRRFLAQALGLSAVPLVARAAVGPRASRHPLCLANAHTGETFQGTYRTDAGPITAVMDELSVFLRDHHSGEKIAIDVGVLDFLSDIMDNIGAAKATVLSAYRTPETNAMLARTTFGVAENSQHLYGRALDIHFGPKLMEAMAAAQMMRRGGVGWYPYSGFIHIDTGPVRSWRLDESGLGKLISGEPNPKGFSPGDPLVSRDRGQHHHFSKPVHSLPPGSEKLFHRLQLAEKVIGQH